MVRNRLFCSIIFAAATIACATAQNGSKKIELTDIIDGVFRQSSATGEMRSLPDGEHYTAMDAGRTMVVKYSYRTGAAVDTLFNVKKARECTFDSFDGYDISGDGHHIVLWRETERIYRHSFRAVAYHYDARRNYVKPLSGGGGKVMIPTLSPDGRMCAFVKDNNIWLRKFDFDTEIQVTKDGAENSIRNGVTDWVYEEEFAVTRLMAWSPDNEVLAFVRFDESLIPEFAMQMYGSGVYPTFHKFKYPKAGEANSKVTLHAYIVQTKEVKALNVPVDGESYIPRIEFTSNPEQLAVMTLNRHQSLFNMYYANPKSGVFRLILREKNEKYIDPDFLTSINFHKSGFTCVSERDGYSHIYIHTPTGIMQRQVTQGSWDVTKLYGYDEATQTVYYESAEESPLQRAVYKIDGKGKKTKLSVAAGTNTAVFSQNFAYFVNRYSNLSTPLVITVNETKTGKPLRTLVDNAALKSRLLEYSFSGKELIKIHTASDYELNAWMLKPVNFDPSKRYPVLMLQYSGPNSQQVSNSFSFDWEYYLAGNGFIVVSVDGRGTAARGEAFRKCTYLRMGEIESHDQVEAARELGKLPYIDKNRIGIWGWSFGGYNTLMALTVGKGTFKAGIAVAPPTDWRYYDSVYTERYMRTPKENAAGYDATSPIKLAANLQGKLLLIHGTADDNVHFNQSMEYAEALVQAGKQFEMQIYKDRNHGISGGNTRRHLYTRMADFILRNL
ncbi:MAG: S9 family peptidase [Tannerellaceae bacterium]|jgi:dipeptidyl-peptidase-4|nr:S9 family peptidase [Tannerellaceae bacterium]